MVLDALLLCGFVFMFDPQHCNPGLELFIPPQFEFIDPVLKFIPAGLLFITPGIYEFLTLG